MPEIKNLEIPKNQLEKIPAYEKGGDALLQPEKMSEQSAEQADKASVGQSGQPPMADLSAISSGQSLVTDPVIVLAKVENILARDMEHVFLSMDANSQVIFKQKGEETAIKINNLFRKTKVKFNEVLNLIIDWLKIIPKVNKHYLEQEAKIKADAIIKLHTKK